MALGTKSFRNSRLLCLLAVLFLLFAGSSAVKADVNFPALSIQISDTTASPGEQNSVIAVYLDNYADSIAGFNIWVRLSNIEIMEFQVDTVTEYDTLFWRCHTYSGPDCTDSSDITDSVLLDPGYPYDMLSVDTLTVEIGSIDTTGTLIGGWEYVTASPLGNKYDLNIVALADQAGGDITPGFAPQSGGTLVKLLADVYDYPDSVLDTLWANPVELSIEYNVLSHFGFSRPDGSSIGLAYNQILDTNMWVCEQWLGDSCLSWVRTPSPPYDSIEIIPDSVAYLDTTVVLIDKGSLTIESSSFTCGDVNGDQAVNISDMTYLVSFLFSGGPDPVPYESADVNCDGAVNISDMTYMVSFLFSGGPAPCANCP